MSIARSVTRRLVCITVIPVQGTRICVRGERVTFAYGRWTDEAGRSRTFSYETRDIEWTRSVHKHRHTPVHVKEKISSSDLLDGNASLLSCQHISISCPESEYPLINWPCLIDQSALRPKIRGKVRTCGHVGDVGVSLESLGVTVLRVRR